MIQRRILRRRCQKYLFVLAFYSLRQIEQAQGRLALVALIIPYSHIEDMINNEHCIDSDRESPVKVSLLFVYLKLLFLIFASRFRIKSPDMHYKMASMSANTTPSSRTHLAVAFTRNAPRKRVVVAQHRFLTLLGASTKQKMLFITLLLVIILLPVAILISCCVSLKYFHLFSYVVGRVSGWCRAALVCSSFFDSSIVIRGCHSLQKECDHRIKRYMIQDETELIINRLRLVSPPLCSQRNTFAANQIV